MMRYWIIIWVASIFLPPIAMAQSTANVSARLRVCHGYGCQFVTMINLTTDDIKQIKQVFAKLDTNPEGEREAIKKAVAIFEERATQIIGVRDEAKMAFGRPGRKGQMDCVDESLNTSGMLSYLKLSGLLKYHDVTKRDSRGLFFDGRYPHWTAVIIDEQKNKWAVDSWYEPGGGEPDIMSLKEWKKHGVGGKR